ncbi:PREDICTED: uncharacterized protein LOC104715739, partial [Camelina sativa]|uniref:Uncharacterized protein LOC104715739 n=1 Tax=Camelina sativa TaxID=90675 RepID=A0ABM1QFR6_CAMSA
SLVFVIERIDEHKGTYSIVPLLLAGLISILYWRFFDDIKPYALVQFVHCIVIPLMVILLPPMYTHSTYWLWAAGFYLLAKVEETADKPIYSWTHHIISGHSLKHLYAAMVPVFLTLVLAKEPFKLRGTFSYIYEMAGNCRSIFLTHAFHCWILSQLKHLCLNLLWRMLCWSVMVLMGIAVLFLSSVFGSV